MKHLFTATATLSLALAAPVHADTILRLGCEIIEGGHQRTDEIMIIEQRKPSELSIEDYEEDYKYNYQDNILATMTHYKGSFAEFEDESKKLELINELTESEPIRAPLLGMMAYNVEEIYFVPDSQRNWNFSVNMHLAPDAGAFRQKGTIQGLEMYDCAPVQFIPVEAE